MSYALGQFAARMILMPAAVEAYIRTGWAGVIMLMLVVGGVFWLVVYDQRQKQLGRM